MPHSSRSIDAHPLAFIDALRGYAITLVIASHSFPIARELPWTVKRFSNLGFFGVQLFFLVSCFTLARSWRQRESVARPGLRGFLLRRLFRIAPAYFLAALFYLWLEPGGAIDATRIVTFLTFTSGWSPAQMPTVASVWVGVPGGWSIEAEFALYALFPVLIILLRGPGRALAALAASLPLAWLANQLGLWFYQPIYGAAATDQFLYYWLPNQLPVFLCGLLVHECLTRLAPGAAWHRASAWLARYAGALLATCLLMFGALAFVPWPRLPTPMTGFVASPVLAALAFGGITLALASRAVPFVVNRAMVRLGQASFSAYLLHFALVDAAERFLPASVLGAIGMTAAAVGLTLFVIILCITGLLAQVTYRLIELPGIRLGARVEAIVARRGRAARPILSRG